MSPFRTLHSRQSTLIIDCRTNTPGILYWGTRIPHATAPDDIARLATRQDARARLQNEAPVALSPSFAAGFPGSPGMQIHRSGRSWGIHAEIEAVDEESHTLTFRSKCTATRISLTHRIHLDPDTDVLVASTEITNIGEDPLSVETCAAPTIPLPSRYNRILAFEGRWSNEFRTRQIERFVGSYLRENRAGRTSADHFPAVVLHTENANEKSGDVCALHLGWSGNHRVRVEEMSDGRAFAQLGELFLPGELSLEPGASYRSPNLYGVHSDAGFGPASRCLHTYVRDKIMATRDIAGSRKVHFNTWEAMYFDLSEEKLRELADAAAGVGAERFVLDDGWFRHRRSDRAGLGDWFVEESIFPHGLTPLIEHVHGLGMEFGLWVEPEMVNPDSDLYRAHPDWALKAEGVPPVLARDQLVLDLTRQEVRAYLFERIDALLTEYPIAYLKWDMNRDLHQPGGHDGRTVAHLQTLALYDLLKDIRAKHPNVEIESCSSGGGRADYGILQLTDRIWTSDNNDAVDRLAIQRGFSFFFPAEIMGSHVGPYACHITGRRSPMATRAAVAFFGSMGIEANVLEMNPEEREELAAAVALHKRHRALIFSGDLVRMDGPANESAFGVVSQDRREALFSWALLERPVGAASGTLRFEGLDPDLMYRAELIWPAVPVGPSESVLDVLGGGEFAGAALMQAGMQLPTVHPQTVLIVHFVASG